MYPHPVLTSNDDIDGTPSFKVDFDDSILCFSNIELNNKYIKELIDSEKAGFNISIENNSSMFVKEFKFNNYEYKLSVDHHNYPLGKYSVELMVIANEYIEDYYSKSFHKDYLDNRFNLSKGSVIANLGYFDFTLNKTFDTFGEKESIFVWIPIDEPELKGNFRLSKIGGRICITYFTEDKLNIIQILQDKSSYLLIQCYIVPALIWAIEDMRTNFDECLGERWALTIIHRMIMTRLIDDSSEEEILNAIYTYGSAYIANNILVEPLIGLVNNI